MVQEFWLDLMGLVAAMQDGSLYVDHDEKSAVSRVSLHIPRYTDQPAIGSHNNTQINIQSTNYRPITIPIN